MLRLWIVPVSVLVIAVLALSYALAGLGNGLNPPGLSGGLNGPGVQSGGSGGNPPPACANELDFSDPCNSQYMAVL